MVLRPRTEKEKSNKTTLYAVSDMRISPSILWYLLEPPTVIRLALLTRDISWVLLYRFGRLLWLSYGRAGPGFEYLWLSSVYGSNDVVLGWMAYPSWNIPSNGERCPRLARSKGVDMLALPQDTGFKNTNDKGIFPAVCPLISHFSALRLPQHPPACVISSLQSR